MNHFLRSVLCVFVMYFSALPGSLVFAEEFTIPVLVGLTGASATFGKPELDAYTLAMEEQNAKGGLLGKKIALQVEDTQTSQAGVISAFQRLALSNPAVVLGPTWLDGFQAVIPIAKKRNVFLLTPSAARESFSGPEKGWPVTFYHNSTLEIQVLVEGLRKRGAKRIGLFYEKEPFAEMIRSLLKDEEKNLLFEHGSLGGETDFRAGLTKAKALKVDTLVIFVWEERSLLSLLQQIKSLFPEARLATVHDGEGWLTNQTFAPHIPRLTLTKFLLADSEFAKKFEGRFSYPPRLTASNAYDAFRVLIAAYESGVHSASDIRNYILSNTHETVTFGKLRIREDGSVPSKVHVIDFKSGGATQ